VVAVDRVVVESFVAVDVVADVDVVAAGVAASAVELFECPDALAARPPIRTVAPTATDPVATVSFRIRSRLRSRLAADGSRLLIWAFEQPFLRAGLE
jgi:hypothetical protein